jgi:hypothetical protein
MRGVSRFARRRSARPSVRPSVRLSALVLVVILVAVGLAVAGLPGRAKAQPRLTVASIAQDPCQPQRALPVPVQLTGQFEPDSSILQTAGRIYTAPGRGHGTG